MVHIPRLHVAWDISHRWAGFFLCLYCLVYSEDSDSLVALTGLAFFAGLYWDSILETISCSIFKILVDIIIVVNCMEA